MNQFFNLANDDFEKAKRRGQMQALLSGLRWKNTNLLSLYDVTRLIKPKGETYRGMQTIHVKNIIGSEGRYHDFSLAFYPKKEMLRARWRSIDELNREDVILPPISVYKVGDNYFVRDGNHRVSVAKMMGIDYIDAEVVELDSEIKLKPGMTLKELQAEVCAYERNRFISQYKADTFLPMDRITSNSPGFYAELVNHIQVHKYFINQGVEGEISFADAARSWYQHVYEPIVEEIRKEHILSKFPGKTEGDLYMWIVRHWDEMKRQEGQNVTIAEAASDYKKRFSKGWFWRLRERVKVLVGRS